MVSNLPALYTKLEEVSVSTMLAQRAVAQGLVSNYLVRMVLLHVIEP
jgi:hypothetical protein